MTEDIRYCPDHGSPESELTAWRCPIAVEGDPADKVTCPHFAAELERRLLSKDLWRLEGGTLVEYRDGTPTGITRPFVRRRKKAGHPEG